MEILLSRSVGRSVGRSVDRSVGRSVTITWPTLAGHAKIVTTHIRPINLSDMNQCVFSIAGGSIAGCTRISICCLAVYVKHAYAVSPS